jgi:hypothetical protein
MELNAASPKKAHPRDCQLAMAGVARANMSATTTSTLMALMPLMVFLHRENV